MWIGKDVCLFMDIHSIYLSLHLSFIPVSDIQLKVRIEKENLGRKQQHQAIEDPLRI